MGKYQAMTGFQILMAVMIIMGKLIICQMVMVLRQQDQGVYQGNFKNAKYDGRGFLYSPQKSEGIYGIFKDGQIIQSQTVKELSFTFQNIRNQFALIKMTLPTNNYWWYTFKNGIIEGEGFYQTQYGQRFWGFFDSKNGQIKKTGKGVLVKDGDFFQVGQWGKFQNKGMRYYSNGTAVFGLWTQHNDKLIKGKYLSININSLSERNLQRQNLWYEIDNQRVGFKVGFINENSRSQGIIYEARSQKAQFKNFPKAQQYQGTIKNHVRIGFGRYSSFNNDYVCRVIFYQPNQGFVVEHQQYSDYTSLYVGEFKDGKYQGEGMLLGRNSIIKYGLFSQGHLITGKQLQIQTFTNNSVRQDLAMLRKNEINGDSYYYIVKKGVINGYGIHISNNGKNYFWGYFVEENGKVIRKGKGILKTSQYIHYGQWNTNNKHGMRSFINGTTLIGEWDNHNLISGNIYTPNGRQIADMRDQFMKQIEQNRKFDQIF